MPVASRKLSFDVPFFEHERVNDFKFDFGYTVRCTCDKLSGAYFNVILSMYNEANYLCSSLSLSLSLLFLFLSLTTINANGIILHFESRSNIGANDTRATTKRNQSTWANSSSTIDRWHCEVWSDREKSDLCGWMPSIILIKTETVPFQGNSQLFVVDEWTVQWRCIARRWSHYRTFCICSSIKLLHTCGCWSVRRILYATVRVDSRLCTHLWTAMAIVTKQYVI